MSLETTKQRLSRKYLGKGGIHGIGLSEAQNAVRVHLRSVSNSEQEADQRVLLEEMKRDAAPYRILVTVEEMPTKLD